MFRAIDNKKRVEIIIQANGHFSAFFFVSVFSNAFYSVDLKMKNKNRIVVCRGAKSEFKVVGKKLT